MKNLIKVNLFFLSSLLLVMSCSTEKKYSEEDKAELLESQINLIAREWHVSHVAKDINRLINLYDEYIVYYGKQKDKTYLIKSKLKFFNKYPDFKQEIVGDFQTRKLNEYEYKCSFTKEVTYDNKVDDFPSYLIFSKRNGEWKIIEEGDLVTDRNLDRISR